MAASDQIKSLIKSFGEDDDNRFFASAMQIAASEARQGHINFAQELKILIEDARKNRSSVQFDQGKIVNMAPSSRELNELIEVFHSRVNLSNMVLDNQVKRRLVKLVTEQKKWELLRHHNLFPIRKLLLTGAPGTGKTMTAHAIAGELGIPVFIIRLDGLLSKYMGESIAKLRLIFDMMPNQRAVYLFDEFDSIGSHRNQGQDIGEIKRVLNSFLINIEKDTSNSIIIAATNLPDVLDNALFRRFDEIIKYPLPTEEEIINAIKKYTNGYTFDLRLNYHQIAKKASGLNYSDIAKACEATIKEKILSDSPKLHKDFLVNALQTKMV
jgi:SpoVK/Ycf46/Vps4 family AAA+-type ATPase